MTKCRRSYFKWGFILFFLLPFGLRAEQGTLSDAVSESATSDTIGADNGQKSTVDYIGDLMTKRHNDSILYLIGNVAFYHNGTIIECDSAKRYDDYRMECFGNVIINKDSTFIYGDYAEYDGRNNIAKVHSPLLKLVNGDATMWVNNYMNFDTRTNIGEYKEGGVIIQRDNFMESSRGIFNADSSFITFIDSVSLRNDNYKIRTDSVTYNLNEEIVNFLSKTYIWDKERDFLTADRGRYIRSTEIYHFTKNAYVLTADQEFWADTIDYESLTRQVTMLRDVQILDTLQRTIGLGDSGYYSDSLKRGMLTRLPVVILYDSIPSTATMPADSGFIRGDTILFSSHRLGMSKPMSKETSDSVAVDSKLAVVDSLQSVVGDSTSLVAVVDSLQSVVGDSTSLVAVDSLQSVVVDPALATADSLRMIAENLPPIVVDSMPSNLLRRVIGIDKTPTDVVPLKRTIVDTLIALLTPKLSTQDIVTQELGDTLERTIRVFQNVKFYYFEVQGVCDSLIAYSVDSTSNMFGNVVLWNELNQLSSDRVDIYSLLGELDYAEFIGNPFIAQRVEYTTDSDSLFNQAEGRLLQTWFVENSINRAIMTGNVINHYYMGDDSLPPDKFAVITCPNLTIDFKDQYPVHMVWGGQATWHIDPIDKIPDDQTQRLPGFTWQVERRPRSRYDITTRSVRASYRVIAEGYSEPLFRIEERINATRESLIKGGAWRDRNEPLSVTIEDFTSNKLLYQ